MKCDMGRNDVKINGQCRKSSMSPFPRNAGSTIGG
jgi:hypothetical protein